MFSLDINQLLQNKTFWIIFGVIIVIFVIRHFSQKINEMSKKFDEMREEDLKILARVDRYKKQPFYEENNQRVPKKTKRMNKGEEKCREIFEQLFNKEFCRIRPDFLKNDCTDLNMEIDGYNDDLKLGFEYQGVQHYKHTPYFHKDIQDFNKQIYRDNLKKEMLEKNGIKVVYIPYYIEFDDLEDFVKQELRQHNYQFD
jgi:hypothetical protein